MKVLLATRSVGKEREIRRLLQEVRGLRLSVPAAEGLEATEEEEGVEAFETFEENAAAKALHFYRRSGLPTLADDSGLVVDALSGAPGVRSKRFAPGGESRSGLEQDQANNEYLLERLGDLELAQRSARFVCVAVLCMSPSDLRVFRGEAEGLILGMARGEGGFGYDPLFYDPTLGKSFAELLPDEKNLRSHRGKAFHQVAEAMEHVVSDGEGGHGSD